MFESEEVTIEITDEITKIMEQNLSEKQERGTKHLKSCKNCQYHDAPWIWGSELYCCSYNRDKVITSRELQEVYDACPINHEVTYTKSYIKKYGIIHHKPSKSSWRCTRGSISVVDFSGTTFEWDGYNPDVDWEPVVTFYYSNQEEADVMMELAYKYYQDFNLDSEYVEKHCCG